MSNASVGSTRKRSFIKLSAFSLLLGSRRVAILAFRTPSSNRLDSLVMDSSWYTLDKLYNLSDFQFLK